MRVAKGEQPEPGAQRHTDPAPSWSDPTGAAPAPPAPANPWSAAPPPPQAGPVDAAEPRTGPQPWPAPGAGEYPWQPARPRPPVATLQDLFGAVSVASLVALLGLPVGWLWSRLAPAPLSVVQEDGMLAALPTESQHRFDDLATFMLVSGVVGLLTGVAVWMLRRRRGPLVLLGLTVGSLLAAWLASRIGPSFADGRYGDAIADATQGAVVHATPRLDSAWIIVVQPLLAAVAYGTAAAANAQQDLGRHQP